MERKWKKGIERRKDIKDIIDFIKVLILSVFVVTQIVVDIYLVVKTTKLPEILDEIAIRLNRVERYINYLNPGVDILRFRIDEIEKNVLSLKNEIEEEKSEAMKEKIILNPSFEDLVNFVKEDYTDKLKYEKENYKFICADFANTFIKRFREKGYYSCTAILYLKNKDNKEEIGHTIVAVNTTDKGIVFIEPMNDKIIFDLKVGDDYCEKVGWNCNTEILKISSCWEGE